MDLVKGLPVFVTKDGLDFDVILEPVMQSAMNTEGVLTERVFVTQDSLANTVDLLNVLIAAQVLLTETALRCR